MMSRHGSGARRPGDRLRALAQRVCSCDTMSRIIDPLIADLQHEHAIAAGGGSRAWRHRLSGYAAFWSTLAICVARGAGGHIRDWATADRNAMGRTIGYSTAVITALAFNLALLPFFALSRRIVPQQPFLLFLYIIPQAVPLAVAFGLPIGILVGLRGRPSTSRIRWSVIGLAFFCAVLIFIVGGWVLPAANQAFRLLMSSRPNLAKGANELTFGELQSRIALLRARGSSEVTPYVYSLHARLASTVAPIIWGGFAMWLARTTRRTVLATISFVVAGIVYTACAAVIFNGGIGLSLGEAAAYLIWLPNLLFAIMTFALWVAAQRGGQLEKR